MIAQVEAQEFFLTPQLLLVGHRQHALGAVLDLGRSLAQVEQRPLARQLVPPLLFRDAHHEVEDGQHLVAFPERVAGAAADEGFEDAAVHLLHAPDALAEVG